MLINAQATRRLVNAYDKRCSKEYLDRLNIFVVELVRKHVEKTRHFKTVKDDVFLRFIPSERGF